ncbi:GDSL-type esterase/lipase family protein [Pedobacter sp. PLR]|uniref:GDSL-type esterase/lipase family protein n=1 Tax=Pedobacter sp. PLR TaxID=2994465 RepID=UPI00224875BB|nr:GDSL-type esterase/lipase family protein [Pedobacter sp. PLR]MCX2453105.1 GDSL-type esterase/lipase family protein [Pedobacter sp. PLR]
MKRFYHFFLVLALSSGFVKAQQKPAFWKEIQDFKHKDSIAMPSKNGILFVGSSSFEKWAALETVFKDYQAINRGFGGSTLAQANYYIADLVYPYQPRQVVIYSGENDIATDGVTAIETLNRFATFFNNIRLKYPEVPVLYISIKDSPSRTRYAATNAHTNLLIKDYLQHYPNTKFVDVNRKMLHNNALRPELFLEDMLHMKPEGYAIWIKEIKPFLVKP